MRAGYSTEELMKKGDCFHQDDEDLKRKEANKGRIVPTPECRACEAVACKGKSAGFFDCGGGYLGRIPRRNLGLGTK